jgi:hypothetical protein
MLAIDVEKIKSVAHDIEGLRGQRLSDFVIEVHLNDNTRMAKAAVASWRWTPEVKLNPEMICESLLQIIERAARDQIRFLFVDYVSIDQTDDDLSTRVIEFSELYKTLPVIFGYRLTITDAHLRDGLSNLKASSDYAAIKNTLERAWISLEVSRYAKQAGGKNRLVLHDIFEFDNNGIPKDNYEFLAEVVGDLFSGFILESQQMGSSFPLDEYLKSVEALGKLAIVPDGYYMREMINAYTPVESIGGGVMTRVSNCEFRTDLLVVAALSHKEENDLARLAIERFSRIKIIQPCSALLLIALAAVSPAKQRVLNSAQGLRESLRVPVEIVNAFTMGNLARVDVYSDAQETRYLENSGFYLQYQSLRAEVSTTVQGNIRFSSLGDSTSRVRDFTHILDLLCSIGEMRDEGSVPIMDHANVGETQPDDHYMLALINAYT